MDKMFRNRSKSLHAPLMIFTTRRFTSFPAAIHSMTGPLLMISAALLFTLANISIKLLSPEFTAWHIAFYRFFGGLLIILLLSRHRARLFAGNNTRLLILRGTIGAFGFICYTTAIRMLPVSTALVIVYAFPAFAAIFTYLIYREGLGLSQCACICLAITGIAILLDFQTSTNYTGQIVALASSALAGLTVTFVRELRKNNGSVVIYCYVCAIGVAVTLPRFLLHPVLPHTPVEWVMVLTIILFSLAGQLLMNQGFYYCRSWEGGVMMSSEAVFTVAAGIFLLGDAVAWRFYIGGLLVFSSSVMLTKLKAGFPEATAGPAGPDT